MKVLNQNNIDIRVDKYPTLITGCDGDRRGEDSITISIDNVEEYETDLMPNGKDLVIHLSNHDALSLIRKLTICIGKNVDDEFKRLYPGVPPF